MRDHGVEREGEADLVVAHPERGFLVIEVKAGPIARDSQGRWWAGVGQLDRVAVRAGGRQPPQPRGQAAASCPAWPAGLDPIAGHAVAFPNVEVASLGTKIF